MVKIDTVVFDLGGVLIDWNPRYLYRKVFDTEEKMETFLEEICTSDWNEEQDAGRSLAEATEVLTQFHPEWREEIALFYGRWEEMLGGPIVPTVDVLRQLKVENRYRLLALTNWSAETFPIAQERYDFLGWFEGILVSGAENMRKPAPAFYDLLCERYGITDPSRVVFIDDNERNILAAQECGFQTIWFKPAINLKKALKNLKIQLSDLE